MPGWVEKDMCFNLFIPVPLGKADYKKLQAGKYFPLDFKTAVSD